MHSVRVCVVADMLLFCVSAIVVDVLSCICDVVHMRYCCGCVAARM